MESRRRRSQEQSGIPRKSEREPSGWCPNTANSTPPGGRRSADRVSAIPPCGGGQIRFRGPAGGLRRRGASPRGRHALVSGNAALLNLLDREADLSVMCGSPYPEPAHTPGVPMARRTMRQRAAVIRRKRLSRSQPDYVLRRLPFIATTLICTLISLSISPPVRADSPSSDPWATIDGDQGLTLVPVLACRRTEVLSRILATQSTPRAMLSKIAVQQGECTRLAAYTSFIPLERSSGATRIRTFRSGRLWIADNVRVKGFANMALTGRLKREADSTEPVMGLTGDEHEAVSQALSEKDTVPGFVRRVPVGDGSTRSKGALSDRRSRECLCTNGRRIHTSRSCDAACGVHNAIGLNGADEEACYYLGERMSSCEEAGRRISEDRR